MFPNVPSIKSNTTLQLENMLQDSRKADFSAWLPNAVEEIVGKWINTKICSIIFYSSTEYDDEGGYYEYISSISYLDESGREIDIEEDIREDFLDSDVTYLKYFGENSRDLFNDSSRIISQLDFFDIKFDLEKLKGV